MNNAIFADKLEKLCSSQSRPSERQAMALLNEYLSAHGFRHHAFTYYSGHIKSGRKLRYECVSEALRPWHEYYLEQGFADVDRTLEEIYKMTLPVCWNVQAQLAAAKNKRERCVRLESIAFGIDKGLSLPVHGPNQDFASLTLHQFRGETCLKNHEVMQYEWLGAAQIFYHYINKILHLHDAPAAPFQLTAREQQCLQLTAKLWRVEKIAKELKISPRTVNFHLQNANKKLGVNNKYQAAFLLGH